MQNTVIDSVRSDIESFKGIRERMPSESSLSDSFIDGYESDNTLDNVSEIAESESDSESSASSESLNCSGEYAANSSNNLMDSTTFREHWINRNGVTVTVTIRDREQELASV
ncbi:hypothetical protein PRIPAC_87567 [Pristionchus pacificus]|uniref:Uncharacterized protein n=1 Tax=Pristionchus pacificus TaxID=54126 RepID=A0A2A6B5H8_PRIPA|nr:hypothetical protein PRIPAC_87567 [Pristionchus pacificus]|eukprot:PDM61145.1 hypothetical protein PRIPAC_50587 [Pristionchus pacificus]